MKKAAKASKQISQETFDEVVKENLEDFDMSLEDATLDAVAQFESQGVDLSNIIKRVGRDDANDDAARSAAEDLRRLESVIDALKTAPADADSLVVEKLGALAAMLDQTPEMKVVAGRHDAVDTVVALVGSPNDAIVEKASALLALLCADNSDHQDFVGAAGLEQLAQALATEWETRSTTTIARLLQAVRVVCSKHESNKSHFAKAKGVDAVCLYLERAAQATDDVLSKAVAAVLRVATINDDPKATFSQAQDTIKLLVAKDLIAYILDVVQTHREQCDVLSAWLIVLKQLAITEEHCKKIYDLGGLDLLFQLMLQHERNLVVVKRCVTVFRNVAAADPIKEYIITSGGAEQIVAAMQTHRSDSSMQQHACATLAAIALRSPENSTRLVNLGAARKIAMAMRTHKTDTAVLRQASLAIRNMVARAPELRGRILEEDVEELLRYAQPYRGCGDEAYAALRDLGCNIKLSSFGTGTQPLAQFNPVNVESNKLLDAVDEAAEAPFAQHA
jgi:armadillo repeat-containing protein 6